MTLLGYSVLVSQPDVVAVECSPAESVSNAIGTHGKKGMLEQLAINARYEKVTNTLFKKSTKSGRMGSSLTRSF